MRSRVRIPHFIDESPFHCDADMDPDLDSAYPQSDKNLWPLVYRPSTPPFWGSTTQLWVSKVLHGSSLRLHSSIVSVHGPQWLNFETPLLNCDCPLLSFWASMAPEFDFDAYPLIQLLTLMRMRIWLFTLMRIQTRIWLPKIIQMRVRNTSKLTSRRYHGSIHRIIVTFD